jgi:hypothetical protein
LYPADVGALNKNPRWFASRFFWALPHKIGDPKLSALRKLAAAAEIIRAATSIYDDLVPVDFADPADDDPYWDAGF